MVNELVCWVSGRVSRFFLRTVTFRSDLPRFTRSIFNLKIEYLRIIRINFPRRSWQNMSDHSPFRNVLRFRPTRYSAGESSKLPATAIIEYVLYSAGCIKSFF